MSGHLPPGTKGYFPIDYIGVALLFLVLLYYGYRSLKIRRDLELGGALGRMSTYLVAGAGFLLLHAVFEFAVVHYDQPWTFAKQWSIAAETMGFLFLALGILNVLRSFNVISS